ncbi:cache domain-containing protein [Ruminococcaceae bacterium OttesenSCG-928-A11]|nr:cache domain-containing protein [Ruminococcaceae bacterium OttesenSCG-928-A11]
MANTRSKKMAKSPGRMFNIALWIALFVISVSGVIFSTNLFKAEFLDSFKYEARSVVETMVSNINQVYREYEDGVISESVGKEIAIHMVQNGVWNDGRRGFWALEPDGTLIAKVENGDLSSKPGDNVWDWQDADGKYPERDMIAVGQNGGGFVEFRVSNAEVDNTYIGYALETDFGFVVDATFDMNYFNKHWNDAIMSAAIKIIVCIAACFAVILFALLYVSRTSRRK